MALEEVWDGEERAQGEPRIGVVEGDLWVKTKVQQQSSVWESRAGQQGGGGVGVRSTRCSVVTLSWAGRLIS